MDAMNNRRAFALCAAVILVSGVLHAGSAAEHGTDATDLAIENATTPAQQESLAAGFRAKAEEARTRVKRHEAMRSSYEVLRRKVTVQAHMEDHCDKLIDAAKAEAAAYDALAAGHEEMAKEAAKRP